jgi:RNA polymerase primary sigma factor
VLTAEPERRLARRAARRDVRARDRLREGSARLVVAIARGYRGRGLRYADLVQEGLMGLLRALPAAPAIRLPDEGNRERAAILRTEFELSSRGRPGADSRTLAMRTGVARRRVERLCRPPSRRLDAHVADGTTALVELVADPVEPEVPSGIQRVVARDEVRAALSALPAHTRTVIELPYGINGGHALTHGQIIGRSVGLTAERCRQIEAEGLRRLRAFADRASLAA